MKSHEVIRVAVDEPGVKKIAAEMKVSSALVYKWCEAPADSNEPEQSGAKNPLDRVKELFDLTGDIRLIRWLCNSANGFFVENPPTKQVQDTDRAIYAQTRKMVRDFSQLLDSVTESVEDDALVDEAEADRIRQRWEDLKANVEHFVRLCEGGHFKHKRE